MNDVLNLLHQSINSPTSFADVILESGFNDEYGIEDLVTLVTIELLNNTVTNKIRFKGTIPLNLLTQLYKEVSLKSLTTKDWITLCKQLDQAPIQEEEKLYLQCSISLAFNGDHFNSARLFSIYLLNIM